MNSQNIIQQESIYAFQLQQYLTKNKMSDTIFTRIFANNSEYDYFDYSRFVQEYGEHYPNAKLVYSGNFFIAEKFTDEDYDSIIRFHTDSQNPFMLNSEYSNDMKTHLENRGPIGPINTSTDSSEINESNVDSEFLNNYSRIIPYSSIIQLDTGIFLCLQRLVLSNPDEDNDIFSTGCTLYTKSFEFFMDSSLVESEIFNFELFLRKFVKRLSKKSVNAYIIGQDSSGYVMTPFKLDISDDFKSDEKTFNLIYGDNFSTFSEKIIKRFRDKNTESKKNGGILLLHGEPGTGKTTYIRYLVRELQERYDRQCIFMTAEFFHAHINNPSFIQYLLSENEDSAPVIIIEDAESIVQSRDTTTDGAVSTLLNMTDGLLRDAMHIQIIASFNTELDNIDTALLRDGRMLGRKCFKKISKSNAIKLIEHFNTEKDEIDAHIKRIEEKLDDKNMISVTEIFTAMHDTEPLIHDVEEQQDNKIGFF